MAMIPRTGHGIKRAERPILKRTSIPPSSFTSAVALGGVLLDGNGCHAGAVSRCLGRLAIKSTTADTTHTLTEKYIVEGRLIRIFGAGQRMSRVRWLLIALVLAIPADARPGCSLRRLSARRWLSWSVRSAASTPRDGKNGRMLRCGMSCRGGWPSMWTSRLGTARVVLRGSHAPLASGHTPVAASSLRRCGNGELSVDLC